jgi:hypothetical protein
MRDTLSSDRVFDIIGEVIPGARLDELLKDAIFNQRRMEEIEGTIETVDRRQTEETMDRVFSLGLVTRHIDYIGLCKETLTAEENRLVPEYVEDYFLRLKGDVEGRSDDTYAVTSVPPIQQVNPAVLWGHEPLNPPPSEGGAGGGWDVVPGLLTVPPEIKR